MGNYNSVLVSSELSRMITRNTAFFLTSIYFNSTLQIQLKIVHFINYSYLYENNIIKTIYFLTATVKIQVMKRKKK